MSGEFKLLVIVLTLISHCGVSQFNNRSYSSFKDHTQSAVRIDSLTSELSSAKGIDRVNVLNDLSFQYFQSNDSISLFYANRGLEQARLIGYEKGLSQSFLNIGRVYQNSFEYNNAIKMYDSALTFALKSKSKREEAVSLYNTGVCLQRSARSEESLSYLLQALEIFGSLNDPEMEGATLNRIGGGYINLSDLGNALKFYQDARTKLEENKIVNPTLSSVCVNIGATYARLGDYTKAMESYFYALKIADQAPDKSTLAQCYINLGTIYMEMKNYDYALNYHKKALQAGEEIGDGEVIAYANSNIGQILIELKKYNEALPRLVIALQTHRSINRPIGAAETLTEIGKVYSNLKNYTYAFQYYDSSLSIYKKANDKKGIVHNLLYIGEAHFETGNFMDARDVLLNGLGLARDTRHQQYEMEICQLLSIVFQEMNDYYNALKYFKEYVSAKDSVFNESKEQEIYMIEMRYDLESREKENMLLKNENTLNQTIIANQNFERVILIASVVVLLIVAILIYRALSLKQRSNKLLAIQNERIIEQSKEINIKNEELQRTLSDLRFAQTQLIQSEKMASLGMLTAGIAHEINNPINFISGGVQALEENILELKKAYANRSDNESNIILSDIGELMGSIKNGVYRTTSIISGLKSFANPDEKRASNVDVRECLDSTLIILNSKLKNIEVVKTYGDIPGIACHPGKINQVFLNIIDNAIHATEEIDHPGRIQLKTYTENNYVVISIQDNGTGITEQVQERIFDPFFTTKSIGKGTGLGLSISYNIIREHQGLIEFKTQKDTGTEFLIKLPIG